VVVTPSSGSFGSALSNIDEILASISVADDKPSKSTAISIVAQELANW
jgi:hypothetical protein